jgi:hypothetical protein
VLIPQMKKQIDDINITIPYQKHDLLNKEVIKNFGNNLLNFCGINTSDKVIVPENTETTEILIKNTISDYAFKLDDDDLFIVEFASKRHQEEFLRLIEICVYFKRQNLDRNIQVLLIYGPDISAIDSNVYDFGGVIFKPHVLYLSNVNASDLMAEVENNFTNNNKTLSRDDIFKLCLIANLNLNSLDNIPDRFINIVENSTKNKYLNLLTLASLLFSSSSKTIFLPPNLRKEIKMDQAAHEILQIAYGDEYIQLLNKLAEKDNALAEKDTALAEKDNALAEKDNALAEKDTALE